MPIIDDFRLEETAVVADHAPYKWYHTYCPEMVHEIRRIQILGAALS